MKIYFFTYEDNGTQIEAFKSKSLAQARVREMKARNREMRLAMQEYLINKSRGAKKPTERWPEPPSVIREAEFPISADGVLMAFQHLAKYYLTK